MTLSSEISTEVQRLIDESSIRTQAFLAVSDVEGAYRHVEELQCALMRNVGANRAVTLTLTLLCGLANRYAATGDAAGLSAVLAKLVDTMPVIYESSHVELVRRAHNLSGTCFRIDPIRARKLLQRVIDGKMQLFGPDHVSTLTSQNVMATFLIQEEDYPRAGRLLADVVDRRTATLGVGHPDTMRSMSALAMLAFRSGRPKEAIDLANVVLEARRTVLGDDHVETQISLNNVAEFHAESGDATVAIELHSKLLKSLEATIGRDHEQTVWTRNRIEELNKKRT